MSLQSGALERAFLHVEFDRRKGWADCATQSCAHWPNWKCGIDMGTAREKVRVAHALESLPRISAAGAASDHPTPGDTPTLSMRRADALARITRLVADLSASGITITPETAVTGWVDSMLYHTHKARSSGGVSAETR